MSSLLAAAGGVSEEDGWPDLLRISELSSVVKQLSILQTHCNIKLLSRKHRQSRQETNEWSNMGICRETSATSGADNSP